MHTAHSHLHLEIQTSRKSPVGILRTSFRENGKMKHTQHGRITGCSLEQLKILQLAFRERVVPVADPQAFQILSSREYGASYAILAIAKQVGLHQALYSRPEPWVSGCGLKIMCAKRNPWTRVYKTPPKYGGGGRCQERCRVSQSSLCRFSPPSLASAFQG
jgi:hypothetical protein